MLKWLAKLGRVNLTSQEVAKALHNFLDGGGDAWDWDDFTSIPIKDPRLNAIRLQALAVDLPLNEEDEATLRRLLAEVERL